METDLLKNEDLKTLAQCSTSLKNHGYTKDFQVTEEGMKETDAERIYHPEDVKIVNFYRFEGDSDPADMSVLYVIETFDGEKGTLVDAFGPYASRKVSEFITQVEDIFKKTKRTEWDEHKHDNAGVDHESHASIGK